MCTSIFLDTAQTFDEVQHKRLFFQTDAVSSSESVLHYIEIFTYNLEDIFGSDKKANILSSRVYLSGVSQGRDLRPVLYVLYVRDILRESETIMTTFADDTVLMVPGDIIKEETRKF